jgi:hypothetical protein
VSLLLNKGADPLAALPTGFLSQFKNYKSLSLQIRRASCHAAALASHFRDEGWMETVAVLDKAVAKRKAKSLDEPTAAAAAAAEGRAGKKKTVSTLTAAEKKEILKATVAAEKDANGCPAAPPKADAIVELTPMPASSASPPPLVVSPAVVRASSVDLDEDDVRATGRNLRDSLEADQAGTEKVEGAVSGVDANLWETLLSTVIDEYGEQGRPPATEEDLRAFLERFASKHGLRTGDLQEMMRQMAVPLAAREANLSVACLGVGERADACASSASPPLLALPPPKLNPKLFGGPRVAPRRLPCHVPLPSSESERRGTGAGAGGDGTYAAAAAAAAAVAAAAPTASYSTCECGDLRIATRV